METEPSLCDPLLVGIGYALSIVSSVALLVDLMALVYT